MYYLLAGFFVLLPWIFFIGIALFSGSFDDDKVIAPKLSRNRQLCLLPGCVRCSKNRQEFNRAREIFERLYSEQSRYERIRYGFEITAIPGEELFFKLELENHRPIWQLQQLSPAISQDLNILRDSHELILAESEKAFKCAYLWNRNEERDSFWYTFSFINQGAWQEEQCRICPELVKLLHRMNSLLTDCVFGNAFISMLPANSTISEHSGMTNARLRAHFGVEIPSDSEHCFMIVGGEKFNWTVGNSSVFDDSFPHSVSSRGCKEDRVVLVLDLWSPELSSAEVDCLTRIFPAVST